MTRFINILSTIVFIIMVGVIGCKKKTTESNNTGGDDGGGNMPTMELKLTTHTPSHITGKTAIVGCDIDILNWKYSLVDECGLCWDTIAEPHANGSHISIHDGYKQQIVFGLNDLSLNTKYYVRAYAIANDVVYYGEEKSFTTDSIISTELYYYDADTISIVLRENYPVLALSDYGVTYIVYDNQQYFEILEVSDDGILNGFNVGRCCLTVTNGYEERTVDVVVNLFREPTFEFGCNASRIKDLYGMPWRSEYVDDSVLAYQYTSEFGYSYACGEMDFFFNDGKYYESRVFIKASVDVLLDRYLNENFNFETIIGDTLSIYRNKVDNNIVCGKFASHNQWNEWCLFYIMAPEFNIQKAQELLLMPRKRD